MCFPTPAGPGLESRCAPLCFQDAVGYPGPLELSDLAPLPLHLRAHALYLAPNELPNPPSRGLAHRTK